MGYRQRRRTLFHVCANGAARVLCIRRRATGSAGVFPLHGLTDQSGPSGPHSRARVAVTAGRCARAPSRARVCRRSCLTAGDIDLKFSRSCSMRDVLELPRLSRTERDRRWSMTREQMRARGIDCLVLWGWPAMWDFTTANARYLCPIGGNAENNTLIFPLVGEPTSFVFMPTFVEYWKRAQDWVSDVRSRRGSWSETVVARLREMGLENA